jgi:hypothetical protein
MSESLRTITTEKVDGLGTNDLCTLVLQYLPLHLAIQSRQVCRRWWYEVFDLITSDSASAVEVPVTTFEWGEDSSVTDLYSRTTTSATLVAVAEPSRKKHEGEGRQGPPETAMVTVPWLLCAFGTMFEVLGMARQKFVVPPTLTRRQVEDQKKQQANGEEVNAPPETALPQGRLYRPRDSSPTPSGFHVPGSSPALPVALPRALSNLALHAGEAAQARAKLALVAHNYVIYCHIATERWVARTSSSNVGSENDALTTGVSRSHQHPASRLSGGAARNINIHQKLAMFRSPDFSKRLKYFVVNGASAAVLIPEEEDHEEKKFKEHRVGPSRTYALQLAKPPHGSCTSGIHEGVADASLVLDLCIADV